MTHQSPNSIDRSGPDNIDAAASADKVAEERQRLATLIGRMLARHWLRQQPAGGAGSSTPPSEPEEHEKWR